MAKYKVTIPTNVEEALDLAGKVSGRHIADGASSYLNSLQDFSWTTLAPTIPTCLAKHLEAELLARSTPEAYQLRTRMLNPIRKAVVATKTFLLGVFRASPTHLGDWGFVVVMAGGRARVEIPTNVKELLELARLIMVKHTADGATSILNGLEDYSWTTLGPDIAPCLAQHNLAESLKGQRDEAYEVRKLLLPPIINALRASRDLLMGVFAATPHRLGDWGFVVSYARRPPRPPKP